MANISKFDRNNLALLRSAIDHALSDVEKAFGVKIDLNKISFNDSSFKASLSAVVGSKVSDPYLQDVPAEYINNLTKYVAYKDALGRKVSSGGKQWVIVGLRGKNFIAKKEGMPSSGMFKLAFSYHDLLDSQVRGIPFVA